MGSGPQYQTSTDTTEAMLKAITANFPGLMQSINGQTLSSGQSDLNAQKVLAPQQSQQQLDLTNRFLPGFTQAGVNADNIQKQGTAENDLALMNQYGVPMAQSTLAAQRAADPQFFAARDQTGNAIAKLYGSLDDPTTGLNGAERAEAERSLARSNASAGNTGPTSIGTVQSAMAMGSAGQARKTQKQQSIEQAIGSVTGAAPGLQSGVRATGVQTPTNNTAVPRFGDIAPVGQSTQQMGSALMQQAGTFAGNYQQNQFNRPGAMDRLDRIGSSCCWIFRERYGRNIPSCVRSSRDAHYTPLIRSGYQRMSKWLIPLMRKSSVVRFVMEYVLFKPLASHAKWFIDGKGYGYLFTPFTCAWLGLWSKLGKQDGESAEVYG